MSSQTEYYPVGEERFRNVGTLPPRVTFEGRRYVYFSAGIA